MIYTLIGERDSGEISRPEIGAIPRPVGEPTINVAPWMLGLAPPRRPVHDPHLVIEPDTTVIFHLPDRAADIDVPPHRHPDEDKLSTLVIPLPTPCECGQPIGARKDRPGKGRHRRVSWFGRVWAAMWS